MHQDFKFKPIAKDLGLKPILVLDNMPYAFVAHPIPNGPYGQTLDPDNPVEYGQFIEALCRELVALYGYDKANTFWFRVGTEPNFTGHRVGTPDLYDIVPRLCLRIDGVAERGHGGN